MYVNKGNPKTATIWLNAVGNGALWIKLAHREPSECITITIDGAAARSLFTISRFRVNGPIREWTHKRWELAARIKGMMRLDSSMVFFRTTRLSYQQVGTVNRSFYCRSYAVLQRSKINSRSYRVYFYVYCFRILVVKKWCKEFLGLTTQFSLLFLQC